MITFNVSISIIILLIHVILYMLGLRVIEIDNYWQLPDLEILNADPFNTLFFLHSNPPLLSFIFWFLDYSTNGNKYFAFNLILPILHVISFNLFTLSLSNLRADKKISRIFTVLFFINPLIFIYFLYPFYPTFIFFSSTVMIYAITLNCSIEKKLLYLTATLSFNSLIRASYHIVIVLFFIFPFFLKANKKTKAICILILLLPLSIYTKNYILYDFFSTSSWLGLNIANHIPLDAQHKVISKYPRYSPLSTYKNQPQLWSIIESKSKKYNYHQSLNKNDFNNYRYIVIARLFLEDVRNNYNLLYSVRYALDGVMKFFESPADYYHFLSSVSDSFFLKDIFDLPDIKIYQRELDLSWYYFFYILTILYYSVKFKELDFSLRYLFIYLCVFTFLYILVDNRESMRMRFEIEPIYMFLFVLMLSRLFRSHQDSG